MSIETLDSLKCSTAGKQDAGKLESYEPSFSLDPLKCKGYTTSELGVQWSSEPPILKLTRGFGVLFFVMPAKAGIQSTQH